MQPNQENDQINANFPYNPQPNNKRPKNIKKILIIAGISAIVVGVVLAIVLMELERRSFGTPKETSKNSSSDTTVTGFNARAQDAESETDIKAIHAQLEAYHAQFGFYPSQTKVNSPVWRAENLAGLSTDALITPKGNSPVLSNNANESYYKYLPTGCQTGGEQCLRYELSAALNDGSVYSKFSLN